MVPSDPVFTTMPNELWASDISHLRAYTPGQFFYLYAVLDWVTRKLPAWCPQYFDWCNNRHHHRALGYGTPAKRHSGQDVRVLKQRRRLKEQSLKRRRRYNVERERVPESPWNACEAPSGPKYAAWGM